MNILTTSKDLIINQQSTKRSSGLGSSISGFQLIQCFKNFKIQTSLEDLANVYIGTVWSDQESRKKYREKLNFNLISAYIHKYHQNTNKLVWSQAYMNVDPKKFIFILIRI